ncbi:MAG: hypothetical protein AAGF12_19580 [Myxococcota bacterium]
MSRAWIVLAFLITGCSEDLRLGRVGAAIPELGPRTLAVQSNHTCALGNARVWCFGSNLHTQLGVPEFGNDMLPVEVLMPDGRRAVELAAGRSFSCARLDDGGVVCWGGNEFGELGRGTIEAFDENREGRAQPVRLVGVPPAEGVFAGAHGACLVDERRDLYCWGRNHFGQIDPTSMDLTVPEPRRIQGVAAFEVALAEQHTCVRTLDQRAQCYGANEAGQLGDGTTTDRRAPEEPFDLGPITRLVALDVGREAARATTCALREDGTVRCWGEDDVGQVGNGDEPADLRVPNDVVGLSGVEELVAGQRGVLARTRAGWFAWGFNQTRAFGSGPSAMNVAVPQPAPFFDRFSSVGIGTHHACGIENNVVFCWGTSVFGSLPGVPMDGELLTPTPYPIP